MTSFASLDIQINSDGVLTATGRMAEMESKAGKLTNSILILSEKTKSALEAEKVAGMQNMAQLLAAKASQLEEQTKLTSKQNEIARRMLAESAEAERKLNIQRINDTSYRVQQQEKVTREAQQREMSQARAFYAEQKKLYESLFSGQAKVIPGTSPNLGVSNVATGTNDNRQYTTIAQAREQSAKETAAKLLQIETESQAKLNQSLKSGLARQAFEEQSAYNARLVSYSNMWNQMVTAQEASQTKLQASLAAGLARQAQAQAAAAAKQTTQNNLAAQYKTESSQALTALNERLTLEQSIRQNGFNSIQTLTIRANQREVELRRALSNQILQIEEQLRAGIITSRQMATSLTNGLIRQTEAQINANRTTLEGAQAADAAANAHGRFHGMLHTTSRILAAMMAYRTLSFIMTVPGGILETNIELEKLKVQLEGVMGSSVKAKLEFERMLRLDIKTPFDIEGLTKTMIMLKNYGLEPTDRVMKALTDSVAKLGGGTDKLIAIGRQLAQAWAKDKLQMIDMRPMIENGLPVISLLQVQLHKTAGEILEMSKKGELNRKVMDDLFTTMENDAPDASARMMKTMAGEISNVKTAWQQLQDAFLEDNSESVVKTLANNVGKYLFKLKDMISNNTDPTKQLEENFKKIAELQNNHLAFQAKSGKSSFGKTENEEYTKQLKELSDAQNTIIEQIKVRTKAQEEMDKLASDKLAKDTAVIAQAEGNEKQRLKAQEELEKSAETAAKNEISLQNTKTEALIAQVERDKKHKLLEFDSQLKQVKELKELKRISSEEALSKELALVEKKKNAELVAADQIAKYQGSKVLETKRNISEIDLMLKAIKMVESSGGQNGKVNPISHALGRGQVLPSTAMDPGFGLAPLESVVSKGKDFFYGAKSDMKELIKFVKEHEDELERFADSYYKALAKKHGAVGALKFYGEPTAKYKNDVLAWYDKLSGLSEAEIKQKMKVSSVEDTKRDITIKALTEVNTIRASFDKEEKERKEKEADILKKQEEKSNSALQAEQDRYNKLTMSAENYLRVKLKADGIKQPQAEKIIQLSAKSDKFDSINNAIKEWDNYSKTVSTARDKTANLATVTQAIFSGSLGGISAMAGAFDTMVDAIERNSAALENNRRKQEEIKKVALDPSNHDQYIKGLDSRKAALDKATDEEKKLNKESTDYKLTGARQFFGQMSGMLEKGSQAQKTAHNIEMAIGVAQMAMQARQLASGIATIAGNLMVGGSKMFKQSGWGGFVGIAAMAAAMAAIGYRMSGAGSSSSIQIPTSPDSGTVLGDTTAKSDSITKVVTTLHDIHASEYRELQGINSGVQALQTGITNSVTKLFQTGGLKTPSNLNLGKTYNSNGIGLNIDLGIPIVNKIDEMLWGSKKRTISDQGLYAGGNATIGQLIGGKQISSSQYTEIKTEKKGGLFGSNSTSYSEVLGGLDKNMKVSLTSMFKGMGSSVLKMADSFGTDLSTSINNYVIPKMKISLFGMSSEKMITKLTNVLSTQLDKMATKVFGTLIGQYQKLGEGMYETATRLASEKAVVKEAFERTGGSLSGDAIGIADGLVQLAGGLKEFQTAFEAYYSKFYTGIEQFAQKGKMLNNSLSEFNLTLPKTREGYKALMNAQDSSTANGRKVINALLGLADSADSFYSTLEELQKTAEDRLRSLAGLAPTISSQINNMNLSLIEARNNWAAAGLSLSTMTELTVASFAKLKASILQPFTDTRASIQDQIAQVGGTTINPGDINGMIEALKLMTDPTEQITQAAKIQKAVKQRYDNEISQISKVNSAITDMSAFLQSLKFGANSILNPEQKLQAAKKQYTEAVVAAQKGDALALGKLANYGQQYITEAQNFYATSQDYVAIATQIEADLTSLGATTSDSVATAQAATDAAAQTLTGSLTTLDSILAGFVGSLGAQFDAILANTKTPDPVVTTPTDSVIPVSNKPSGITGNGATETYTTLSKAQQTNLDIFNTATANAALKGQSKAYVKEQKNIASAASIRLKADQLKLNNYNYWHSLGDETKAVKSVQDVINYLDLQDKIASKKTTAKNKKTYKTQAAAFLEENGGTLHFRAKGGITQGNTVMHEDGPELMDFKQPTMIVNNEKTRSIISLGNEETVAELKKQTEELKALVRLQQAANKELIKQLNQMNDVQVNTNNRMKLDSLNKAAKA